MSTLGFDSDVGVDVVRLIRGTVVWDLWKDAIRRRWEVHGQAGAGVLWKRRVEVLFRHLGRRAGANLRKGGGGVFWVRPQPADAQDSEGTAQVGEEAGCTRARARVRWVDVGWTLHSDFTWLFQPGGGNAVPRARQLQLLTLNRP